MGQRSNAKHAAGKDAQIKLRKEECAGGMVESIDVAVKDVQIKSTKKEYAGGTGHTCSHLKCPQSSVLECSITKLISTPSVTR